MKSHKIISLCIILSLTIVMTLSSNIFATGITTDIGSPDQYVLQCLPDLLSHLSSNTNRYGLNNSDLSNFSVSSSFAVSGGTDNATYYALMSDTKVLGIITVNYTYGKYSLSYAEDFADLLTTLYVSNTPFSLSWDYYSNTSMPLAVQTSTSMISSVSSSLNEKLVTSSSTNAMLSSRSLNDSGELTNGNSTGSYMIDMMDPYTPSWRIVFWDGVDELTYSFVGNEKVWRKTIVLYS